MLDLYIPKVDDLWFEQQMLSDPATMSYNQNWDVSYDGYHRDTGCIDLPESQWGEEHRRLVGNEPEQFYAYIRRTSDGAWLGTVNFHYNPENDWYDMGIVLYSPYRGQGYAVPALKLMLDHAFRVCNIHRIHNDFELCRNEVSAWRTHFAAGFREIRRENGWLEVMLTREEWFQSHLGGIP